jgi:hypothetical protein
LLTRGGRGWIDSVARVPTELLLFVFRYILAGDVDVPSFNRKVALIANPVTRNTVMTAAQILRQEGRTEQAQSSVIDALEVRFDRVPEGLVEALREVESIEKLKQLHKVAISCDSLDAFAAAL